MTVEHNLQCISPGPTAVALGFFDGVHLGHRQVIDRALETGNENKIPAVFTFEQDMGKPHKGQIGRIITERKKMKLLGKAGIQWVLSPPFSAFSGMSPQKFVTKILRDTMQAKKLVCGYDFHFGAGGKGDAALLRELARENGMTLEVVPEFALDGERVSSSAIRSAVASGDIAGANRMLGFPFAVEGDVIQGNRIGRTIDFPTINTSIPDGLVCPRYGVYISRACVNGKSLPALTNIGVKPTVGKELPLAETHILNYSGDLYGQFVEVELLEFVRPEQKFPSIDALRAQIARNVETARQYFSDVK